MNKTEAIQLLYGEGWTKEDAKRALKLVDFKTNSNVDEIIIRRAASKFAGSELIKRQRSQADQKRLVTIKSKQISEYKAQIQNLEKQIQEPEISPSSDSKKQIKELTDKNTKLIKDNTLLTEKNKELTSKNTKLTKANNFLKKDNKDLKNIVDEIKLKLAIEIKYLLQLENSEIKKGLFKLLKSTLG